MADEDDRDPVALGELHQPEGRLADLADAAGRAVELVDRRGLDRIDDERAPGRVGAGQLDDPADLALGDDPDARRPRAVEQPEPRGAQPDLPGRFLAGGVEDVAVGGRQASGHAGRGLEEERRLADPRLAADQHERPGDEAAAQDPVELADARRQARHVGLADVEPAATGAPRTAAGDRRRASRAARAGSRTTVSTRVFQAAQARHWPSQRRNASPQAWQT